MILFVRAEFTMYLTHAQHLGTEHVVNIYFILCYSLHRFSKEKIINNLANFLQSINFLSSSCYVKISLNQPYLYFDQRIKYFSLDIPRSERGKDTYYSRIKL